jgi:hypothetical protein
LYTVIYKAIKKTNYMDNKKSNVASRRNC